MRISKIFRKKPPPTQTGVNRHPPLINNHSPSFKPSRYQPPCWQCLPKVPTVCTALGLAALLTAFTLAPLLGLMLPGLWLMLGLIGIFALLGVVLWFDQRNNQLKVDKVLAQYLSAVDAH